MLNCITAILAFQMLSGCGNTPSNTPSDVHSNALHLPMQENPTEIHQCDTIQAENERKRKDQLGKIRSSDVFSGIDLREVSSVEDTYPNVQLEHYEDAMAWEAAPSKTRLSTYVFIGKTKSDTTESDDMQNIISDISEFQDMDNKDAEIVLSTIGDYVMAIGGNNVSTMIDKFNQVIALNTVSSVSEIYQLMMEDITLLNTDTTLTE